MSFIDKARRFLGLTETSGANAVVGDPIPNLGWDRADMNENEQREAAIRGALDERRKGSSKRVIHCPGVDRGAFEYDVPNTGGDY